MADYADEDEQAQAGLPADLSGGRAVAIIPRGLADALTPAPPAVGVVAPQGAAGYKVPGYISSVDGRFVPLLPGMSPGAFAAQQQNPLENLLSGYGAETMNFGREAADLAKRGVAVLQGSPAASMVPGIQDPDKDIQKALFKTSPAADGGRILADLVNTYPIGGVAGDLVAPIAQSIRGEAMLPTIIRATIPGVAKGIATGTAIPADDADERLHHILTRGAFGAGYGAWPVVKMLADH